MRELPTAPGSVTNEFTCVERQTNAEVVIDCPGCDCIERLRRLRFMARSDPVYPFQPDPASIITQTP